MNAHPVVRRLPVLPLFAALIVGSCASGGQPAPDKLHTGMCDASGGVLVGESMFAVANDEDNFLRIYDVDEPGPPRYEQDLSDFLEVDRKHPETDIEGVTKLGQSVYWITSHGRSRKGKLRESRQRFFATEIRFDGSRFVIEPVGIAYHDLLADMLRDERLKALGLAAAIGVGQTEAAELAPKRDGINIEALAPMPDKKGIFLGFRNPRPQDEALIVPLVNPAEVVAGKARAEFGEPVLLPLGGLGIRGMESVPQGGYLIIAGSYGSGGPSHLYRWSGRAGDEPRFLRRLESSACHAEGLIVYDDRSVLFIKDCGSRLVGGKPCKSIKDAARRAFETSVSRDLLSPLESP